MGFDGVPRIYPQTDPLNPYLAEHAARSENASKPRVKEAKKDEKVIGVHKELPQYDDEDEGRQEPFSEEELEQIMIFARMRGIMNLALEKGVVYQFQVNPETGLVDLIAENTGKAVLSLTPEELMELTQKVQRYAGVLTDRSG